MMSDEQQHENRMGKLRVLFWVAFVGWMVAMVTQCGLEVAGR